MTWFDAFRPTPVGEAFDWKTLHSATDGLVKTLGARRAEDRAGKAAQLYGDGDVDGAIRASGDPDFGVRARHEQRAQSMSGLDQLERRVGMFLKHPSFARVQELGKQADEMSRQAALLESADPEVARAMAQQAERFKARYAEEDAKLGTLAQQFGVTWPLQPPGTRRAAPPVAQNSAPQPAPGPQAPISAPAYAQQPPVTPAAGGAPAGYGAPGGSGVTQAMPAAPAGPPMSPTPWAQPQAGAGAAPAGRSAAALPEFALPPDPFRVQDDRRATLGHIGAIDLGKGTPARAAREARDKQGAEYIARLATEAATSLRLAAESEASAKEALALAEYVEPGFGQQQIAAVKSMAERMGFDTNAPAEQLFGMVTGQMVMRAAESMKGALSDKDLAYLQQTNLSGQWTPDAIKIGAALLINGAKRQQFISSKILPFQDSPYRPNLPAIYQAASERYPTPVQGLLDDMRRKRAGTAGDPGGPISAAPDGRPSIPPVPGKVLRDKRTGAEWVGTADGWVRRSAMPEQQPWSVRETGSSFGLSP